MMHVTHKEGLTSPEWEIMRKIHCHNNDGTTKEIKIKDSIRQGGVLSVAQYAMDEINREIRENILATSIPSLEDNIGCLLWMDYVVLISPDFGEL